MKGVVIFSFSLFILSGCFSSNPSTVANTPNNLFNKKYNSEKEFVGEFLDYLDDLEKGNRDEELKEFLLTDNYLRIFRKVIQNEERSIHLYTFFKEEILLKLGKKDKPAINDILFEYYYPNNIDGLSQDEIFIRLIAILSQGDKLIKNRNLNEVISKFFIDKKQKSTNDEIIVESYIVKGARFLTVFNKRNHKGALVWFPVEHKMTAHP